jgi:hypothetical protein
MNMPHPVVNFAMFLPFLLTMNSLTGQLLALTLLTASSHAALISGPTQITATTHSTLFGKLPQLCRACANY